MKNTVISPNILMWKFCGKAQFPHSFGRRSETEWDLAPYEIKTSHELKTLAHYLSLRFGSNTLIFFYKHTSETTLR